MKKLETFNDTDTFRIVNRVIYKEESLLTILIFAS